MATFEYKIVTSSDADEDDETLLNDLGGEGWELVSVHVSQVETYAETGEESEDGEGDEFVEVDEVATYYLKREKAA